MEFPPTLAEYVRLAQREYIQQLAMRCANVAELAAVAGKNRTDMYKLIERVGLSVGDVYPKTEQRVKPKNLMTRFLSGSAAALVLLFACAPVFAQSPAPPDLLSADATQTFCRTPDETILFRWSNAGEMQDGSPIAGVTGTAVGWFSEDCETWLGQRSVQWAAESLAINAADVPLGRYCWSAWHMHANNQPGDRSIRSNVLDGTIAASCEPAPDPDPDPEPLPELVTVAESAYQLAQLEGGRLGVIPVGAVPLGTSCSEDYYVSADRNLEPTVLHAVPVSAVTPPIDRLIVFGICELR